MGAIEPPTRETLVGSGLRWNGGGVSGGRGTGDPRPHPPTEPGGRSPPGNMICLVVPHKTRTKHARVDQPQTVACGKKNARQGGFDTRMLGHLKLTRQEPSADGTPLTPPLPWQSGLGRRALTARPYLLIFCLELGGELSR